MESGTSQVGSNSSWNQEPKATSSGLSCDRKSPSFQGQSCWSPQQWESPLHAAMGKEVEKSELKQPYVSHPINVIIHSLITEMVSHCSGRLGKTDRPEPGFCQTGQLSNTRDWVLMNGNSILLDKAGSFQVWNPVHRQNSFLLLH